MRSILPNLGLQLQNLDSTRIKADFSKLTPTHLQTDVENIDMRPAFAKSGQYIPKQTIYILKMKPTGTKTETDKFEFKLTNIQNEVDITK